MNVTISELQKMGRLNGFRLIAGEKGLNNEVSACCVLDYEFDPELKNKFQHSNFKPGLLVFTSFLYAKDKTYLIAEAVRQLIKSEASGLVIRNVYHLSISESLLRYADSSGFPIFLLEDTDLFIDSIFSGIHDAIRVLDDMRYQEEKAEWLMNADLSEESRTALFYELFPGIRGHYMVYFYAKLPDRPIAEQLTMVRRILVHFHGTGVFVLRKSLVVIAEAEYPDAGLSNEANSELCQMIDEELRASIVGISNVHYHPGELKDAIEESITSICCADLHHPSTGMTSILFNDIGSSKILIHAASDKRMQQFAASIIDRVSELTNGGSTDLVDTLVQMVECGGSLHQMSEKMGLHENTLRQRMGKVRDLTGLDCRAYEDYEQLSLAVRINRIIGNRKLLEI